MDNNNSDWLNLTVEQALKISNHSYRETPAWLSSQAAVVLTSFQEEMYRRRDWEEELK